MSDNSAVLAKWDEVKVLVETLELDIHKNVSGNMAAGVRARKGLRAMRKQLTDIVKLTVSIDKGKKDTQTE